MKLIALHTNSIDSFRDPSSYSCHGRWGDCSQLLNAAVGQSSSSSMLSQAGWSFSTCGVCLLQDSVWEEPTAQSRIIHKKWKGAYQGLGREKQEQYPPRTLNLGDSLAKLKVVLPTGIWCPPKSWSYTLSSSSSPTLLSSRENHMGSTCPHHYQYAAQSILGWFLFPWKVLLAVPLWTNGICINIWEERVEAVGSKICLVSLWELACVLHSAPLFLTRRDSEYKMPKYIPLWHLGLFWTEGNWLKVLCLPSICFRVEYKFPLWRCPSQHFLIPGRE